MNLLDLDDFEKLRSRQFTLDCCRMTLTREGTDEVVYSGAGRIEQTVAGALQFVLYDAQHEIDSGDFRAMTIAPGEWVDASHFFVLTATDLHDRTWRAKRVDVGSSGRFGRPGTIVRGGFNQLAAETDCAEGDSHLIGFAPLSIEVPTNRGTETIVKTDGRESTSFERKVWVTTTPVGRCEITKYSQGILVSLENDMPHLPDGVNARLEEALTFVLAHPVRWTMLQTSSRGRVRLTVRAEQQPRRPPRIERPIEAVVGEAVEECGRLFATYLDYVVRTPPTPPHASHPLAMNVMRVLRASSSFIEDERLALAVQVESIVRRHFAEYGQESADVLSAIRAAVAHLEQWPGPADIRTRVVKAVQSMTGSNPRTALRMLAAQGVIREDHVLAWEEARHRPAHGLSDSRTTRDVVTVCNLVHQLLLLLVYRIIGFTGQLTDYTVPGWPLRPAADVARAALPPKSPSGSEGQEPQTS